MEVDRLQIKDVAERTGFSPATLRYYEDLGLLPRSTRTRSGYRLYDESTLDRLAFIGRAKQLGRSLDEIAQLTRVWDGGRCGPVQDHLRTIVGEKLALALRQIDELRALATELQRAASDLAGHRPDGPCDNDCGCTNSPQTPPESVSQPVFLRPHPGAAMTPHNPPPIACTLGPNSMIERRDAWSAVLRDVHERQAISGGLRLTFTSSVPLDALIRLVAAEHECCSFFSFAITVDGRGSALEVTAPEEASSMVDLIFGGHENES
jgi:MerR family transcriptional regulator, copper efflux regulator